MSRRLAGLLTSAGEILADTPVRNIPGVPLLYRSIGAALESDYEHGEQWIEYEGYQLKICPPDHVSKELATRGVYEPREASTIRKHVEEGDTVLDIGAHIGNHTLTLRDSVADTGYVFAFEPNPRNAALLSDTVTRNGFQNVEVVNKALGESDGTAALRFEDGNTGSATVLGGDIQMNEIEIEVVSLESFLSMKGIDSIDFMKIDVQGGEINIIPHIDLRNVSTILLEVHCGTFLSDDQVSTIHSTLTDYGVVTDLNGKRIHSLDEFNRDTAYSILWQRNSQS